MNPISIFFKILATVFLILGTGSILVPFIIGNVPSGIVIFDSVLEFFGSVFVLYTAFKLDRMEKSYAS